MTSRIFRIITWVIAGILIITSLFLVKFSLEAASETENWSFLDFDFTDKEGVISSYGSFLAAVLSFIAILLVLLDLFYQRRLKEIENEEMEAAQINAYRDNLNIILLFCEELCKEVINQFQSSIKYVAKEKNYPTEMNRMSFVPNTYPKLILDVDRLRFYDSIQYFKPSDNWRKLYVDLYKITDFYDKTFAELNKKHQIHLDKKFKHCRELAIALDDFIDINSDIRNNIIVEAKIAGTLSTQNPYFGILQFIKNKAIEIISRREENPEDRTYEDYINPASFTVWHDEVWQPAFGTIIQLWNEHGNDPHNLKSLLNSAQMLIREYSRLIQDSEDYSNHIESHFTEFFSEESKYVKKLKGIINAIKLVLN